MIVPKLDNGANFSAIGFRELYDLSSENLPGWTGELEPLREQLLEYPHW